MNANDKKLLLDALTTGEVYLIQLVDRLRRRSDTSSLDRDRAREAFVDAIAEAFKGRNAP